MHRVEAVVALAVAFVMITAGLTWLFGAWGLIAPGTFLAGITLFVIEVKGDAPDA
jgi:hypothetical protein